MAWITYLIIFNHNVIGITLKIEVIKNLPINIGTVLDTTNLNNFTTRNIDHPTFNEVIMKGMHSVKGLLFMVSMFLSIFFIKIVNSNINALHDGTIGN
ncbi:hypothetical protein B9Z52_14375 [Limnohabitans sp. Jir72]|nr:hypothetical protein B9Z52_14375 [Limnohabitans sp. Jir72]